MKIAEQDSGGNGGQRPSFASLWTPNLRRATLLAFVQKEKYEEYARWFDDGYSVSLLF